MILKHKGEQYEPHKMQYYISGSWEVPQKKSFNQTCL